MIFKDDSGSIFSFKKNLNPHFMILPSLSCPASCSYCFGPNTGKSMDEKIAKDTVGFIAKIVAETRQNQINITLHGGEPLAAEYKIIELLIQGIYDKLDDVKIGIQSNLWLLDEKLCRLFSEYHVEIGTSLDGPMQINDAQRGAGYFEKTMSGIKMAREYGINVGCIATLTAKSVLRWKEVFDFFIFNNLHFAIHPAVSALSGESGQEVKSEQYAIVFEEMFDYYIKHCKNIKISTFDQLCQGVAQNQGAVCTFRNCFGMFLAIDPDGNIYPCQRFIGNSKFVLGNLQSRPAFSDLLSNTTASLFYQRESALQKECGQCKHFQYCRGGCPYNALSETGELKSRDTYCESYKKIFSTIRTRLYQEMISNVNLDAIEEYGVPDKGNPLLCKGTVIDLTKENAHPYDVYRSAKRIIAAYELGRYNGIEKAAQRLVNIGISESVESAQRSLNRMDNCMKTRTLNKIYIHVTWNCQLTCSHCYIGDGRNKDVHMSVADIERIIIDAYLCGFQEIVITGGEPLMHKDRNLLLEKLAQLRQQIKPIKIVLRSNLAILLTIEDWILLSDAFDKVVVSIDGDKDEHDLRRGKGTYDRTVANIMAFNENVQVILNKTKSGRLIKIAISAALRAEDIYSDKRTQMAQLARILNVGKATLRTILPIGRAANYDKPLEFIPLEMYERPQKVLEDGFQPAATCGIGEELYIEPTGDAFPCYAYNTPHALLGNAILQSVKDIVESKKFKSFREHSVDTNSMCKVCDYRYICGGACRAWQSQEAQCDLDATSYDCSDLKKRAHGIYLAAMHYLDKTAD